MRIIQGHVVHLQALLTQSLGEMAHGAENQGDLLRMMRHMAGLFHHLGQQHVIMVRVDVAQRTKAVGELVAQNEKQTTNSHSSTISMFGWRRRWPSRM